MVGSHPEVLQGYQVVVCLIAQVGRDGEDLSQGGQALFGEKCDNIQYLGGTFLVMQLQNSLLCK